MGASQFCEVATGPDFRTAYSNAHASSAAESGSSYGGNLGTKSGCEQFGSTVEGWNAARTLRAIEDLVNHVEFGPEDAKDDESVLIRDEWFDLDNLQHVRGRLESATGDAAALAEHIGHRQAAILVRCYLDKWGPAVAVQITETSWVVCGLASS